MRAVIVTGAGRGFCAGADLRDDTLPGSAPPPPPSQYLRYNYNPGLLALASLPKPVVAAVNGAVAGAGLGIALAADVRIASSVAKFVPSFAGAGLIPDMGVTYFAVRTLGYTRAFEWLTGGVAWTASEALQHGLVNQVMEPAELLEAAIERARRLVELPSTALGLTKRALAHAYRASLAEQLEVENELQSLAIADPDRAAARATLMNKITKDDKDPAR